MRVVALTLAARRAGRHQPPRRLLPPARGAEPHGARRRDGRAPRPADARRRAATTRSVVRESSRTGAVDAQPDGPRDARGASCSSSPPRRSRRPTPRSRSASSARTPTACSIVRPRARPRVHGRPPRREPEPGQAQDPAIAARRRSTHRPRERRQDWGLVVDAVQPVHEPGEHARQRQRACCWSWPASRSSSPSSSRRSSPTGSRRRSPGSPRRRAGSPTGTSRSRVASDELSQGTLELRELSASSSTPMADRLEESVDIIRRDRDYSRDFARRREPRAADADRGDEARTSSCSRARPARTRRRGPSSSHSSAHAARPARLARPEPARAVEAGLRARAARPAPGRRPRDDRVGRRAAARRRGAQGDHAHRRRSPTDRSGSGTTRRGSGRSCPTSWATRSSSPPRGRRGPGPRRAPSPTAGRGSRSSTRAWASRPTELPLIFDRFYRGRRGERGAVHRAPASGLAIVKSIVDMHHGSIAVESRVAAWARGSSSSCRATRAR